MKKLERAKREGMRIKFRYSNNVGRIYALISCEGGPFVKYRDGDGSVMYAATRRLILSRLERDNWSNGTLVFTPMIVVKK